jgi:gamma-glutamyl-gamma-aminobutyrate hydrolase PuuD
MIVGVVAGRSERSTGIYTSYLDAILGVGGSPVIIAPSDGYKNLDDVLGILDCLLLAGGGDIEPRQYKQAATASLERIDPVRDEIELWAATSMRAAGKRILGICRGAQLLAVAARGSRNPGTTFASPPGARTEQPKPSRATTCSASNGIPKSTPTTTTETCDRSAGSSMAQKG